MALRQDGGSLELFCFRIVSPPHPSWQVFFLRNTLDLHIKGHYWRTIGDKKGEAGEEEGSGTEGREKEAKRE